MKFASGLILSTLICLTACTHIPDTQEDITTSAVPARDPFVQPFTSTSIWNMPLGSQAQYVKADIPAAPNTVADVVHVLQMKESDPVRQVYVPENWFDRNNPRCEGQEKIDLQVNIPDDYIVPDIGVSPTTGERRSPYGLTPNSTAAFIFPDGERVLGASLARCEVGGPVYVVPYLKYPNNVRKGTSNLYGDGLDGSGHGATQLSSFGGLLRKGELTNDDPINHAVKLMIWGQHLYYSAQDKTPGYRWPAKSADSYAAETYNGETFALQMGSLLAIRPEVELADLNLKTKAARKLFVALQDYGAYITEDPNWDAHAVTISEEAYLEFEEAYGYTLEDNGTPWAQDLNELVGALYVVNNNWPRSIGGGGTPRRPLAPSLESSTGQ